MQALKEFIQSMYHKKYFWQRFIAMILSVITMGFTLSLLIRIDWGTDPCTTLNLAISGKLGISIGNWQALFNTLLFIPVILWGRRYIGFGTLGNMFLVGYAIDFFDWIWDCVSMPAVFEGIWLKILVLIPSLAVFILAVGVYLTVDLGTAPYDALPYIISGRLQKLSFRSVRMIWDITMLAVGILLGGQAGIVTVLMAFCLGPAITWVERQIKKRFSF